MQKLAVPLCLLGLVLLTFHAFRAEAKPCVSTGAQEQLTPVPFAAPTFNGREAVASPNGRYSTDAGVEFSFNPSPEITASPEACTIAASQVTLRFIDPWTGEARTMTLGETP